MDTPKGLSVLFVIALERVPSSPVSGWWQRFLSCRIAYKTPKLPGAIRTSCGLFHRREEREQPSLLNFSLGLGTVSGAQSEPVSLEICKMRILLLLNGPRSYSLTTTGEQGCQQVEESGCTPGEDRQGDAGRVQASVLVSLFISCSPCGLPLHFPLFRDLYFI